MKLFSLPARTRLALIGCMLFTGLAGAHGAGDRHAGIDDHSTDPAYAKYYRQTVN